MVMRKFKKPEDNGSSNSGPDGLSEDQLAGLNSPRMGRRNRGGSFSGQQPVQDSPASGYDSPSVRRRRSRIPSEEDDKLVRLKSIHLLATKVDYCTSLDLVNFK